MKGRRDIQVLDDLRVTAEWRASLSGCGGQGRGNRKTGSMSYRTVVWIIAIVHVKQVSLSAPRRSTAVAKFNSTGRSVCVSISL